MSKSCKNCDHRTYDDSWGGPLCDIYKHSVRNVDKYLDCQQHKEKQAKEEKRDE